MLWVCIVGVVCAANARVSKDLCLLEAPVPRVFGAGASTFLPCEGAV